MEVHLNLSNPKNINLRVEKIWSHKISIEILISIFEYTCAHAHTFFKIDLICFFHNIKKDLKTS